MVGTGLDVGDTDLKETVSSPLEFLAEQEVGAVKKVNDNAVCLYVKYTRNTEV